MARRKTTFTVYPFNPDGRITPVDDPQVILRMRRLTRSLWQPVQGSGSVITTYLYRREEPKRTEEG